MKAKLFYLLIVMMLFSCKKEYVMHDPVVVFPNTNYVAQYNGNLNITMLEGRGISVTIDGVTEYKPDMLSASYFIGKGKSFKFGVNAYDHQVEAYFVEQ